MTKARSNATANAAKGDLTVGNGTNLSGVLGVGSNGDTIVADSSTSTGLRYQGSMAAGKNPILNGGFDVWQRGTSFVPTASGVYCADRWQSYRNTTGSTVSRQVTNDTTNLAFIQYCSRVQRDSGNASAAAILYSQSLETVNAIPFAGKAVTFSFYARAGANYSPTSSLLTAQLKTGTGTDQNALMVGYTGTANTINQNVTLTTTWQRFQYTATLPATTTEFAPYFTMTPTGTAGAADYYEITGVQVEVGSVATQFTRQGGTIQGELAACQRYYWQSNADGGSAFGNLTSFSGVASSSTALQFAINTPVSMRVKPSSVSYSTIRVVDGTNALTTISAVTVSAVATAYQPVLDITLTGATQFRMYAISANNSTSGYIALSAEL